jgi:hypothetical protein
MHSTLIRTERTLDKTRRGGLPAPYYGKIWVGPGSSKLCDGCGDVITRDETEHEVEVSDALTFRLHAECHHAWIRFSLAASRTGRISRRTEFRAAPPPAPAPLPAASIYGERTRLVFVEPADRPQQTA